MTGDVIGGAAGARTGGDGADPSTTAQAPLSVMDRIYAMRDRLLERPAFHRWIARFPLTRGFARAKERALFNIIAGFVHTKVLSACVQLGVLDHLKAGPTTLDALSVKIGLTPDATRRLLDAAVSLDLVSRRSGGRYGLGDLGAAVATTPAFATVIAHNAIFYSDITEPVRLLRGEHAHTELSRFWAYAHADAPEQLTPGAVEDYSRFMAASQALIADDVLDAYPLARHRRLLDVGGGDGTFLSAAGRRHTHLALELFDLPAVAAVAERRLVSAGLAARSTVTGGSFHADPLPQGADVMTLIRVLLDHPDDVALAILQRVRAAIAPGGTLLVAETIAGGPEADAYFGFYLMAMGRGRARSFEELAGLMTQAGFVRIRRLKTYRPTLTSLLSAVAD